MRSMWSGSFAQSNDRGTKVARRAVFHPICGTAAARIIQVSPLQTGRNRGNQPARRAGLTIFGAAAARIIQSFPQQKGTIRSTKAASDTENAPNSTRDHGAHKASCAFSRCAAAEVTTSTNLPGAQRQRVRCGASGDTRRRQPATTAPERHTGSERYGGGGCTNFPICTS